MQPVHMNPAEAVRAHLDLGSASSIGMHFGTFRLTTEGIDEPVRALADARKASNISAAEFDVLEFGASRRLPRPAERVAGQTPYKGSDPL